MKRKENERERERERESTLNLTGCTPPQCASTPFLCSRLCVNFRSRSSERYFETRTRRTRIEGQSRVEQRALGTRSRKIKSSERNVFHGRLHCSICRIRSKRIGKGTTMVNPCESYGKENHSPRRDGETRDGGLFRRQ